MKMKNKIKLLLDFIMIIIVATFFSTNTFGLKIHEIGGLCICLFFLLHILLNTKWLKYVPKRLLDKTLPKSTKVGIVVNLLLFICFLIIVFTGVMMSKTILQNITIESINWRVWHYFVSSLCIILVGIHIGLHVNWLKAMFIKLINFNNIIVKIIIVCICLVIMICGAKNIYLGDFSKWITMPFNSNISQMHQENKSNNFYDSQNHSFDGNNHSFNKNKLEYNNKNVMHQQQDMKKHSMQSITFSSLINVILKYTSIILCFSIITSCFIISTKPQK